MKQKLLPLLAGWLAAGPLHAGESTPAPKVDLVVLVHGIFDSPSCFNPLRKRLEALGIRCHAPQLTPRDGGSGLDQLAEDLKRGIDAEFGPRAKFAVIGYSMGGLVCRHYLQNLGGADRCAAFLTISSPHHGSNMAHLYPSRGAVQMRPGSEFLAGLKSTEHRLGRIPVVSYRTPLDLMILPSTSSIWDRAENVAVTVAMHPLMLHSDKVLTDIERRLSE